MKWFKNKYKGVSNYNKTINLLIKNNNEKLTSFKIICNQIQRNLRLILQLNKKLLKNQTN